MSERIRFRADSAPPSGGPYSQAIKAGFLRFEVEIDAILDMDD